jgi:hypothetical protein
MPKIKSEIREAWCKIGFKEENLEFLEEDAVWLVPEKFDILCRHLDLLKIPGESIDHSLQMAREWKAVSEDQLAHAFEFEEKLNFTPRRQRANREDLVAVLAIARYKVSFALRMCESHLKDANELHEPYEIVLSYLTEKQRELGYWIKHPYEWKLKVKETVGSCEEAVKKLAADTQKCQRALDQNNILVADQNGKLKVDKYGRVHSYWYTED